MPGFDRTGPAGYGPMTGRRRGLCTGLTSSRFANWRSPMPGRGERGRGHRWRYYATGLPRWARMSPSEDVPFDVDKAAIKEALEEEASLLADELNKIKMRLEELKTEEDTKDEL